MHGTCAACARRACVRVMTDAFIVYFFSPYEYVFNTLMRLCLCTARLRPRSLDACAYYQTDALNEETPSALPCTRALALVCSPSALIETAGSGDERGARRCRAWR